MCQIHHKKLWNDIIFQIFIVWFKSLNHDLNHWFKSCYLNQSTLVGTHYEERYTALTVKHPPSQIVWGARMTAGLYFLPPWTTMNGEKYDNLLKSKFELHMRVHNCDIFKHDGAPCHQSKIVKNFEKQKCSQRLE